jgi:hypothetical protein
MGIITKFAAEFAKGYVSERGVKGTMEDAVNLMQGVGNVGKKLFGSKGNESESDEYEEYENDEAETNFFDEKTWKELCDGIEALKEESNYAGALNMLHDYYRRFQVNLDYLYFYLKAGILLAEYDDLGRSPESDFSCKTEVDKAIQACDKYGDEDEELLMTIELQDKFESTKLKVSYWRKMYSIQDEIDALRDPEHVVTTSKVNDVLKALELVDNFWKEESTAEDGSVYNIDFLYLFKARIYNAFFFYLAENKQELDALSDEQLSEFFVGATDCADKVLAFSECDDKTDEEFLNRRIPEQIEELKQLRCGKKSSMHSSSSAFVTSEEQEYLEEIRACLDNDGEISSRERRLLDRLRKTLGITEVRAKELEASVNDMSDDEKEYQEELKACLEDGTISDRERRLLDRLRKSLGISEERAKAIEDRLLKQ